MIVWELWKSKWNEDRQLWEVVKWDRGGMHEWGDNYQAITMQVNMLGLWEEVKTNCRNKSSMPMKFK